LADGDFYWNLYYDVPGDHQPCGAGT